MYIVSTCLAGALLAASAAGPAADELAKIDRRITKEPAYTAAQPLYGLVAFGPAARTRVWLVLDKSKPDADRYDVLYADLNADGDLTDPAERLTGRAEGGSLQFRLPDFKDPATGAGHTAFGVRVSGGAAPTVMVSVKWRGGHKMGGGYPEDPDTGYLRFADKPAAAPILLADGDSPLRFQRWYSGKLSVGAADDFKVFVGQPGVGPNSFWAFQEHFLPESEFVQATLVYQDERGEERRAVSRLDKRC